MNLVKGRFKVGDRFNHIRYGNSNILKVLEVREYEKHLPNYRVISENNGYKYLISEAELVKYPLIRNEE